MHACIKIQCVFKFVTSSLSQRLNNNIVNATNVRLFNIGNSLFLFVTEYLVSIQFRDACQAKYVLVHWNKLSFDFIHERLLVYLMLQTDNAQ